MNFLKLLIVAVAMFFCSALAFSQVQEEEITNPEEEVTDSEDDVIEYEDEISYPEKDATYKIEMFGSVSSGSQTPFWIVNNTWGMVPLEANNYYLRAGAFYNKDLGRGWSTSLGLDLAQSSMHVYDAVWLQQLYAEISWRPLRLSLGAKEDNLSMLNRDLSSGDYVTSTNARPIPMIRLSIPEFLSVPFTSDYVSFKGDFSVGYHFDGDYLKDKATQVPGQVYVEKTLTHTKSLFLRFGNIKKYSHFQAIFGIQQHTLWGGTIYRDGQVSDRPKDWNAFMDIVFPTEYHEEYNFADSYVLGNLLGTYNVRLDYDVESLGTFSTYYLHFIEVGSSARMKNMPDMLLGFEYKAKERSFFSGAVFEYFNSRNQCGPIHFVPELFIADYPTNSYGVNDYYNNSDYTQGYSYYGRSLGTPFMLSPEYNDDGIVKFKSNRVTAYYLGLEGYLNDSWGYRLKTSYGKTWGRYYVPFPEPRSGMASSIDLMYEYPKIKGLDFKFSVGFDSGRFYPEDTFGGAITITKRGNLF